MDDGVALETKVLEVPLTRALKSRGYDITTVIALAGGRTNRVYRASAPQPVIIKVFSNERDDNSLFPNLPQSEVAALRYLNGSGIAPQYIDSFRLDEKEVLIYGYIDGEEFQGALKESVPLLQSLHSHRPEKGFRTLASHSNTWLEQGIAMLEKVGKGAIKEKLITAIASLEPVAGIELAKGYLVHGDCTIANIIRSNEGLKLIDWQCPGIGDPIEDYATLTSPAMHFLSNKETPSEEEHQQMIAEMDKTEAVRYQKLYPLLHWRINCYSALRAEQYKRAGNEEMARRYGEAVAIPLE